MATLLVGLSGAPATAADLLDINAPGTLVARGAAVDVAVSYTCTPPSEWSSNELVVRVSQVVRRQTVAAAEASVTPVCDGAPHLVTVRASVPAGGDAFKTGSALVDASLTMGDMMSPTITIRASEEIRLAR